MAANIQDNLDNITESVICIPFDGDAYSDSDEESDDVVIEAFTHPDSLHRDIPTGPSLRHEAYNQAWSSCLDRLTAVVHNMQKPVTTKIVDAVRNAYLNTLPLLPYVELPILAVTSTDQSATSAIFHDVREQLISDRDESTDESESYVTILTPSDCANITAVMKSIITGFVSNPPSPSTHETQAKHNASASLAAYDINVLKAWYKRVKTYRPKGNSPLLVILIKDFEQLDPEVMQRVFYVCSQNIPQLPIVFIIALSTPIASAASFIHATYPRSTLALLRLTPFQTKCGMEALHELLTETFFSAEFQPIIIPGSSTFDFIAEQYLRYSMSTELVVAILQLAHMRHFVEPLTAFANNDLLGNDHLADTVTMLDDLSSPAFVHALAARLHHPEKAAPPLVAAEAPSDIQKAPRKGKKKHVAKTQRVNDTEGLLHLLRKSREVVHSHARRSRIAFRLFSTVRSFLVQHGLGYRNEAGGFESVKRSGGEGGMSVFEMMSACLKGTLVAKEGKYMGMVIRKLSAEQLEQLISRVYGMFYNLPSDLRSAHSSTNLQLVKWMNSSNLNGPGASTSAGNGADEAAKSSKIGAAFVDWLMEYLSENMTDVADLNMWDLWYMGNPSVISEVINPSPREALISALLHPEDYLQYVDALDTSSDAATVHDSASRSIHTHPTTPDLTVLFRLYLESGKTINVYDWLQAFEMSLEAEKKKDRRETRGMGRGLARNGVKGDNRGTAIAKGKGKGRASPKKRSTNGGSATASPSKANFARTKKGKGKQGPENASDADSDAEMRDVHVHDASDSNSDTDGVDVDKEADEGWRREVLFRFLRAVQELDFLGFLKQTKRKKDHVGKTVFEVPD